MFEPTPHTEVKRSYAALESTLPADWPHWKLLDEYRRLEMEKAAARDRHSRFVALNAVLVTGLLIWAVAVSIWVANGGC